MMDEENGARYGAVPNCVRSVFLVRILPSLARRRPAFLGANAVAAQLVQ